MGSALWPLVPPWKGGWSPAVVALDAEPVAVRVGQHHVRSFSRREAFRVVRPVDTPRPQGHQPVHFLAEVPVTGIQVEVDAGELLRRTSARVHGDSDTTLARRRFEDDPGITLVAWRPLHVSQCLLPELACSPVVVHSQGDLFDRRHGSTVTDRPGRPRHRGRETWGRRNRDRARRPPWAGTPARGPAGPADRPGAAVRPHRHRTRGRGRASRSVTGLPVPADRPAGRVMARPPPVTRWARRWAGS